MRDDNTDMAEAGAVTVTPKDVADAHRMELMRELVKANNEQHREGRPSARQLFGKRLPHWMFSQKKGWLIPAGLRWNHSKGEWEWECCDHTLEGKHLEAYKHAYEEITGRPLTVPDVRGDDDSEEARRPAAASQLA